jgi:hypothetical protein
MSACGSIGDAERVVRGINDEDMMEKEVTERMERKDRKQAEGGKKLFELREMRD